MLYYNETFRYKHTLLDVPVSIAASREKTNGYRKMNNQ